MFVALNRVLHTLMWHFWGQGDTPDLTASIQENGPTVMTTAPKWEPLIFLVCRDYWYSNRWHLVPALKYVQANLSFTLQANHIVFSKPRVNKSKHKTGSQFVRGWFYVRDYVQLHNIIDAKFTYLFFIFP